MDEYKSLGMDTIWTMKTGEDIQIKNMEDSHIINCIGMLKRYPNNPTRNAWEDVFNDVLLKRRKLKLEKIYNKLDEKFINNKIENNGFKTF